MVKAIFDIMKDEDVLQRYVIPELSIEKGEVEKTIFEICGLNNEQYEVNYLDEEDDPILAEGEDDYFIARDQIQGDTIVFHISIKVEEGDIKFSKKFRQPNGDEQNDFSDHEEAKEDRKEEEQILERMKYRQEAEQKELKDQEKNQISGQPKKDDVEELPQAKGQNNDSEKVEIKDNVDRSNKEVVKDQEPVLIAADQGVKKKESLIQIQYDQKEQEKLKDDLLEEVENAGENVHLEVPQAVQCDHVRELSEESERLESCLTDKSQKLVSSMSQKLLQVIENIEEIKPESIKQQKEGSLDVPLAENKSKQTDYKLPDIKIWENQDFLAKLNSTLMSLLHKELKPTCFKKCSQGFQKQIPEVTNKNICSICRTEIIKVPFYINQTSQKICCTCEPEYDPEQLLVKIRSQKQACELHNVQIIPSYKKDPNLKLREETQTIK